MRKQHGLGFTNFFGPQQFPQFVTEIKKYICQRSRMCAVRGSRRAIHFAGDPSLPRTSVTWVPSALCRNSSPELDRAYGSEPV
jgi:hypothetical protein